MALVRAVPAFGAGLFCSRWNQQGHYLRAWIKARTSLSEVPNLTRPLEPLPGTYRSKLKGNQTRQEADKCDGQTTDRGRSKAPEVEPLRMAWLMRELLTLSSAIP